MKGKISITVSNKAIQYKFELRRNITIIKGDSATGKTTLVDMIREFDENGVDSDIRSITLGGQDETIYEETDSLKIARAFRKAGRSLHNE